MPKMCFKGELKSHPNLYDRVQKLLISYEWSDCLFKVSGDNFKAHKLILGISSPVFAAMLYGPLSSNEEIIISDIESDIFQLLLNYIYTDKVELTCIEQAFELLYASRKYLLDSLTSICIQFIERNISLDNVLTVLSYPEHMQDEKLTTAAMKLFCQHARYLLQENISQISNSLVKIVLNSEQINISEKDLIKNVFDWSQYCCGKSKDRRREFLIKNDLFRLLRFFTLSPYDLNDITNDENNLLLPSEADLIASVVKSNKTVEASSILGNSKVCRRPMKVEWSSGLRCPVSSAAPIKIDSNKYSVATRVKTTKSIFVNSLCIPTRLEPVLHFHNDVDKMYSEQISVSIILECDNSTVKFTNFMNTVEYDSSVDIELSEPCLLKKDMYYKILFEWPQHNSHTYDYLVETRDIIYVDNRVVIEFEDIPLNGKRTGSFLCGLKFCV